jgi:beta-glucosidase
MGKIPLPLDLYKTKQAVRLVMSDWTGTNSVSESIQAGCNLEMPGPAQWRGKRVMKAIANGEISRSDIENSAIRVLQLVQRTKGLSNSSELAEQSINNPETAELIRKTAAEGIVLLKNESNLLPLANIKSIAVIGPNAQRAVITGGGSASLNPLYSVGPLEGIRNATNATVTFHQGCDSSKWLPLASDHCMTHDGQQGVILEYYKGDNFGGEPISVQHKTTTDLFLWDSAPKEVLPAYSFKVKTTIVPQSTGQHVFSFSSVGPGRLYINKQLFIDNWNWNDEGEAMFEASRDAHKTIYLKEGKVIDVLVESTNEIRPLSKLQHATATHKYGGCRIGYQEESVADLVKEATEAAAKADVAVVCVGLDAEWESEGYDRQTMDLPKYGSQDRLIEAVLAANPRTVIVIQSGTPVTMPWIDRANCVIQAWYQGQEAGNALADVIFGKTNASGKLPNTFPRRLEDNPSHGNWPGENREVTYAEGIYAGYRHYDKNDIEPLFPFGHGLSYTTFEFGTPQISSGKLNADETLEIRVPVTNSGSVAGHEVVQAYTVDVESSVPRPVKELKAFDKVLIQPGETQEAVLHLDKYSMGFYDTATSRWLAEAGSFEVLIGASSRDIR